MYIRRNNFINDQSLKSSTNNKPLNESAVGKEKNKLEAKSRLQCLSTDSAY